MSVRVKVAPSHARSWASRRKVNALQLPDLLTSTENPRSCGEQVEPVSNKVALNEVVMTTKTPYVDTPDGTKSAYRRLGATIGTLLLFSIHFGAIGINAN